MALSAALRARIETAKNKYQKNTTKTIKPKDGRNLYRILAPTDAEWVQKNNGEWWAELGVHWIKAAVNGKPIAVVGDPTTTFGEPSVVNTAIERAIATAPDSDSQKLYESWRARQTILINVVNRDDNNKVEVLELTKGTFGKILDLIEMFDDNGEDITDPKQGYDIVIKRDGKGLNTEYTVMAAPGKSIPVTEEQIKQAVDLISFIRTNYFRGEEKKALAAIASTSGIDLNSVGSETLAIENNVLKSSSAVVKEATTAPEDDPELTAFIAKAKAKAKERAASEAAAAETHASQVEEGVIEVIEEDASGVSSDETDELIAALKELNE